MSSIENLQWLGKNLPEHVTCPRDGFEEGADRRREGHLTYGPLGPSGGRGGGERLIGEHL